MTLRFSEIDDLTRRDHWHLGDSCECYYLREYTADRDYLFGSTNNLISNFKKDMDRKDKPEWVHKEAATTQISGEVAGAIGDPANIDNTVFVPIPPSEMKGDPAYDDRLLQVLQKVQEILGDVVVIRELVEQIKRRDASHAGGHRLSSEEHAANYCVNTELLDFDPSLIIIFDDVITTGSSFMGMKKVLSAAYPNVRIIGMFVARCIHID